MTNISRWECKHSQEEVASDPLSPSSCRREKEQKGPKRRGANSLCTLLSPENKHTEAGIHTSRINLSHQRGGGLSEQQAARQSLSLPDMLSEQTRHLSIAVQSLLSQWGRCQSVNHPLATTEKRPPCSERSVQDKWFDSNLTFVTVQKQSMRESKHMSSLRGTVGLTRQLEDWLMLTKSVLNTDMSWSIRGQDKEKTRNH